MVSIKGGVRSQAQKGYRILKKNFAANPSTDKYNGVDILPYVHTYVDASIIDCQTTIWDQLFEGLSAIGDAGYEFLQTFTDGNTYGGFIVGAGLMIESIVGGLYNNFIAGSGEAIEEFVGGFFSHIGVSFTPDGGLSMGSDLSHLDVKIYHAINVNYGDAENKIKGALGI
jgi:hypothetical protein